MDKINFDDKKLTTSNRKKKIILLVIFVVFSFEYESVSLSEPILKTTD